MWSEDETSSSYVAAIHTVLLLKCLHPHHSRPKLKEEDYQPYAQTANIRCANMIYQTDYASVNEALVIRFDLGSNTDNFAHVKGGKES